MKIRSAGMFRDIKAEDRITAERFDECDKYSPCPVCKKPSNAVFQNKHKVTYRHFRIVKTERGRHRQTYYCEVKK